MRYPGPIAHLLLGALDHLQDLLGPGELILCSVPYLIYEALGGSVALGIGSNFFLTRREVNAL